MNREIESDAAMRAFGEKLGGALTSGVAIELVGDVGAGKTTFVKGLARGLEVSDDVQSPTFTISRIYKARDGLELRHYDFYRLNEPGVMQMELAESIADPAAITVVEWGDIVADILPRDHVTLRFSSPSETSRHVTLAAGGENSQKLIEVLQ
ncbi:MAG TPA: tRNA (adenosine(37)-N6)-threonylcarbamoyltransferase complex ATPase subunit type 1 TsaE [Candidatus Saccharimonadaceae bacterium]|nr:tRNA (adenosine(37)-N6)-threonylcarbamoyltransferase complex ATPase subunit type 1 TsaE [Candidatus Saccharimonadaceae bacterium]